MRLAPLAWLALAAQLILASCSGEEAPTGTDEPTRCQPGDLVYCLCPDNEGVQGQKRCSGTGRSFGPCTIGCNGEPLQPQCEPGSTDICACDDGTLGVRTCYEDGLSYGECLDCGGAGAGGAGGAGGEGGQSGAAGGVSSPADVCPGIEVALAPGEPVQFKGTTAGASGDNVGTLLCASTVGGDHVYTLLPSTSGQLTARLDPQGYDGALYLRDATCLGAQVACSDLGQTSEPETMSFMVTAGQSYHLFVDGITAGPYALDLSLATSFCGDGKVTKPEACDDGNTEAGDGCAPDCTVEQNPPSASCPGVEVHLYKGQAALVVSGTTKGYPNSSTSPGFCNFGPTGEKSPDRVYRVIPDATGTLRARLTSASFDSLIYTRQGACSGAEAEDIACQDLEGPNQVEQLDMPVQAGQPTWLFVDGYSPLNGDPPESGTFSIELSVL